MKKIILYFLLFTCLTAAAQNEQLKEIIYGHKDGLAMTMLMHSPTNNIKGKAVINIISGNWISSYNYALSEIKVADVYTQNGYTVFNVMHGTQPRYNITEAIEDIKRAVKYIRFNAASLKIDGDHIGIVGSSSGGHLALMVATTATSNLTNAKDSIDQISDKVQAVCAFFPPTDFLNFGATGYAPVNDTALLSNFGVSAAFDFKVWDDNRQVYNYANKEQRLQISKEISPIYFVSTDDPPAYLIHGDKDDVVPLQQSETFVTACKKLNIPIEFLIKKGEGHGWKNSVVEENLFVKFFDKFLL